jgi:hypothetical protein
LFTVCACILIVENETNMVIKKNIYFIGSDYWFI